MNNITLERVTDYLPHPHWKITAGNSFLYLTDEELRELVTLAVAGDLRILPE